MQSPSILDLDFSKASSSGLEDESEALAIFSPCRFCMVYSEVPNFSEPNPEYSAQQAPNKTVSPMAMMWGKKTGQAKEHGREQGLSM